MIAEIIFEPQLRCLYFLMMKGVPNTFKFVKIDLQDPKGVLTVTISKDVHFFEINKENSDEFYMISHNVIYHTGFKLLQKSNNFNFFGLGETQEDLDQKGLTEFYRSMSVIEFIRFTGDRSKFFVNEDKSIRLMRTDNKEVLKIFSQHNFVTIDVAFDKNLEHLYR